MQISFMRRVQKCSTRNENKRKRLLFYFMLNHHNFKVWIIEWDSFHSHPWYHKTSNQMPYYYTTHCVPIYPRLCEEIASHLVTKRFVWYLCFTSKYTYLYMAWKSFHGFWLKGMYNFQKGRLMSCMHNVERSIAIHVYFKM